MIHYSSGDILISPLDDKNKKSLEEIKTYLEIHGVSYHQNTDNPNRKEYHYFMGDSVVFISELPKKANIKILSATSYRSSDIKKSIEGILDETEL